MRVGLGFGRVGVYQAGLGNSCYDEGSGQLYECGDSGGAGGDTGTPVTIQFPGGGTTPDYSGTPVFTPLPIPAGEQTCYDTSSKDYFYAASCAASGGVPVSGIPGAGVNAPGSKPSTAPSTFSSILASIFGQPVVGIAPSSAAACAAAKGVWNGVSCVGASAPGTINLGGMVISTTTLLIGGALLFLAMKKK